MKEDVGAVAKEMGRDYMTIYQRFYRAGLSAGKKKGKFSAEEIKRMKTALMNNEDHNVVAKELDRDVVSVSSKMYSLRSDPDHGMRAPRRFSLQEDLLILDKVILGMDVVTKLSCVGRLSSSIATKLAEETGRSREALKFRWDQHLLTCLLQHYSGTSGFKIEIMLTRLVAEKFTDYQGIDWFKIVSQHQEFMGHTGASLGHKFQTILSNAKKAGRGSSLQEVAEYAADVYQPGKERKESSAKVARREAIISHFKRKVDELGINVML